MIIRIRENKYKKKSTQPPPLPNLTHKRRLQQWRVHCLQNLAKAQILKHLVETEKSTFQGELSFQRSESTAGLTVATILCVLIVSKGGHAQLFLEFAIAIPQLEGVTSAIAIPQLFKTCCSATATPQSHFFLKSATLDPQLESFTFAILGIFLALESGRFMTKKLEVKNLMQLSL
jgi:hypothetical protein